MGFALLSGQRLLKSPLRSWWSILWPPLLWMLWLRWAWPVPSLFHGVPAGEDTWQAIAMLLWYSRVIQEGQGTPFFYPLAFAPQGLHTISLHYNPFLIGLMLPWSFIGGPAFGYNLLGWIAFTISFLGTYRLTYLLTRSSFAATAAGIAYSLLNPAYFGMRAFGDHVNVAWGLGFCPLILYELERGRRAGWKSSRLLRAGVWWGLASSGSFYMLPLALPILAGYGWLARRGGVLKKLLFQTVGLALLLVSPWAGAFLYARYADQLEGRPISWLSWTSTDWKDVVRWNPYHPALSSSAESPFPSIGGLIAATALLGIGWTRLRGQRLTSLPLLAIAGIAAFLATGPLLRWGGPVRIPWPDWWNELFQRLWAIGYSLKPAFFESPTVPSGWRDLLISPGFLLWVFIPFWEMVIFPSRYLALLGLGLYVSGAEAWVRSARKPVQMGVFVLWSLEALMGPGKWVPWPPALHPAFHWLRAQASSGRVVDMVATPQVRFWSSGSVLLAPLFHGWPTLSGFEAIDPLWAKWLTTRYGPEVIAHPERLSAMGVRYVLLHILSPDWREERWPGNRVERVECFDPPPEPSPWDHPICLYRLPSQGLDTVTNLLLAQGWSGAEPWGIWAEGRETEALWIVRNPRPARLELQAFPLCGAEIPQQIQAWINGSLVGEHTFSSCDEAHVSWKIPLHLIRRGTNVLRFQFAYAFPPLMVTQGRNPDTRPLSVGFRKLWIDEDPS
ncbi:hypothetical protein [Thermoflexus sp.]|uniref:hypothetical protein n=1 Tax=Thermoflexus sp. TaxID=1969742 RepID=UPI002ADD903B|nr:hypothetical protein [Thermoflexus sp.]